MYVAIDKAYSTECLQQLLNNEIFYLLCVLLYDDVNDNQR